MAGPLPEPLAEEDEAELGEPEGRKVDEDDDPVRKLEEPGTEDSGACATDHCVEDQVVEKPGYPVSGLGEPHHGHRLPDARLLLRNHTVRNAEGRREEREKGSQGQKLVENLEHELIIVEGGRLVGHGDHGDARCLEVRRLSQYHIRNPVLELRVSVLHVLLERDQVWTIRDGVPGRVELRWYTSPVFVSVRLIVVVHVQLVPRVGQLDNFKSKADQGSIFSDAIVRVLNIIVQELGIFELAQCEVVKHIWCVLVLLLEDQTELIQELDLNSIVILHESDGGRVAGLGRELRLLWI